MTIPADVPSYVQGYRFSDESAAFYDASAKKFHDRAGYGPRAGLQITSGTPVFATVSGHRCVTLDNTFHGQFPMPIPWMGSVVAVMKPEYASGATLIRYPLIFGDAVSGSSNGLLSILHFSGQRRISLATPSSLLACSRERNDNNLVVFGAAVDQETRKGYATVDGVTVVESSAAASSVNGLAVALSSSRLGARFGDMDNDPANLAQITDLYCHIFELHFFAENIWVAHAAQAGELMASLRETYAVV